MKCVKCGQDEIASVSAKCSDMCNVDMPGGKKYDGYVPIGIGLGGGDYMEFNYCIACGQIQDDWNAIYKNLGTRKGG